MSNYQSTNPEVRLNAYASEIAGLNLKLIIHPAQGGTYDFEADSQLIEFILNFYADIASTTLNHVPQNVLETMCNNASDVLNAINTIKSFNYTQGDPNQNSRQYIQNLKSQWREAYNYAAPHIAYAKVSSSAIARELRTIQATINENKSALEKASEEHKSQKEATDKQIADQISELKKVTSAAREASVLGAVATQATEFEAEAGRCLEASRKWLYATIGTVALSLLIICVLFLIDVNSLFSQKASSQTPNQQLVTTVSNQPAEIKKNVKFRTKGFTHRTTNSHCCSPRTNCCTHLNCKSSLQRGHMVCAKLFCVSA